MNYYPFHIGDFRSGTVNMSRHSRWIYRDMLDVYYDTERPLSLDLDELCEVIGAESDEERRIVERHLRFKFTKTEIGYTHEICDKVISDYHKKAETAQANGKLGGRPKKQKASNQEPTGLCVGSNQVATATLNISQSKTNQEPRTTNQEPVNTSVASAPPEELQLDLGDAPDDDLDIPAKPGKREDPHFDRAWERYPKRAGGNPKNKAEECWRARLREGHGVDEMIAGVDRYHAYCKANGWIDTGYTMQAKRFFGTEKNFLEDWKVGQAPPGSGRPSANAAQQVGSLDHSSSVRAMQESNRRHGIDVDDDSDDPILF